MPSPSRRCHQDATPSFMMHSNSNTMHEGGEQNSHIIFDVDDVSREYEGFDSKVIVPRESCIIDCTFNSSDYEFGERKTNAKLKIENIASKQVVCK